MQTNPAQGRLEVFGELEQYTVRVVEVAEHLLPRVVVDHTAGDRCRRADKPDARLPQPLVEFLNTLNA